MLRKRAIVRGCADLGLAAVGMLPEVAGDGKQAADETAQKAHDEAKRGPTAPVRDNMRRPRAGSKWAQLVALLAREGGVTVDEMASALDWQEHTARGVLSGTLKKRFGLVIVSEMVEGRGRVYRTEDCPEVDADR